MSNKPNILILMPDQLRADSLGCAGHSQVATPNIDRIAHEGARLSRCFTQSPICMSARASFISGLYPHNHGMWDNAGCLPPDDESFFQTLRDDGYTTATIGKNHYYWYKTGEHLQNSENYLHHRGFDYIHEVPGPNAATRAPSYMSDHWESQGLYDVYKTDIKERQDPLTVRPSPLPVEEFPDSYVGRQAAQYIQAYNETEPFCLFVGFPGPHEPWDAPGEYAAEYDPAETPPAILEPNHDSLPEWVQARKEFQQVPDITAERIAEVRANYYGKISLIDHWVGEILKSYESRGWLEDLLIIFWSDHGDMLGDHGRVHKQTFHESSIHVPLLIRWPGMVDAGQEIGQLVELVDIFPTVLDAAGISPSKRCLGHSLLPLLKGETETVHDSVLSEIFFGGTRNTMIRTGRYKLAVDDQARAFMLYDLKEDPHEQQNLVENPAYAALEQKLRNLLLQRILEEQFSMEDSACFTKQLVNFTN